MTALLCVFVVLGAGLIVGGRRLGPRAFLVGGLAPAVTALWAVAQLPGVLDGRAPTAHVAWVPRLDLTIDLRLDGLALTMTLLVSIIGVAVFAYASLYFRPDEADLGRLAGLLVLFAGAMVGLVQADHLLVLYTCWEITSITSYLLIGNRHTDADARAAALHALLVTGGGGLAMLGGFVVLGQAAGSYQLHTILAGPVPHGPAMTVAVLLILLGAFTKSAQYPFHAWLPGAMAAPTPVSAYLHSATMVKAGVYLVARLAPLCIGVAVWRPTVLVVGLVSLVAGGLRALRQHDLKLLLAFSTISQLGLLIVLFGAGTPAATTAGWVLLVSHALFKAALFLVVGVMDHQTGTRDLRHLPALHGARWRVVEAVAGVSVASMAGVPLTIGFIAKEGAYGAFHHGGFTGSTLVLAVCVAGSMLTVAYAGRFWWGAFVAPRRRARPPLDGPVADPTWRFIAAGAVLAVATLVLGVAPGIASRLVTRSVQGIDPSAPTTHLAVWHGWELALALSALTFAGGVVLAFSNRRAQQVLAAGSGVLSGESFYLVVLRALANTARRVTGVVQNGSLPVYAGVILLTAALAPAVVLVYGGAWPTWPTFTTGAELPVASLVVLAALGAALVRRRFHAAVFLSVVGYAMAGIFVLYGAPDLALTQVTVETLSTVVFVLVLRKLPDRFDRQSSTRRRLLRAVVAALVGLTVFGFALIANTYRAPSVVSHEMTAKALPEAHGRNIVNVILIDFRGLDTLGEITVLAAASIGAVALARIGRRPSTEPTTRSARRDGASGGTPPRGTTADPARIVFVDVTARLIFHVVLMASLWLLFAGHNRPGGGFVGGLLAGSAIALRYVVGGIREVRGWTRVRPWTVLGTGVLLAVVTAIFPLLRGQQVLHVASRTLHLPLLGDAHLTSALVFDAGVYLTVVGMVLMIFEAFGDEPLEAQP